MRERKTPLKQERGGEREVERVSDRELEQLSFFRPFANFGLTGHVKISSQIVSKQIAM